MDNFKLSVVSPIYRAEKIVNELVNQIAAASGTITENVEIILVDDYSPDNSWNEISTICAKNNQVKGIKLSKNYGQQMAISAGLRYATGDIIIIMDGDLQNPPESIPVIAAEIKKGYDIVYTVSKTRNHWRDELTSKIFWYVINTLFKVGMIPNQLMMKGFNKKYLEAYNSYDERIRVVAGITHDIGLKQTTIEVDNKRRTSGKGNYTFFKRFHLMLDIILTMTNKPLNYLINISMLSVIVSVLVGIYTSINYIIYPNVPPGYTTLLLFISFFGSLTLLVLGIIGRYLSNIYIEVRNRPIFLVQQLINVNP
ncbi:MAG: glycosyltransferase family 2 protein [Bacteroidota bacterium]